MVKVREVGEHREQPVEAVSLREVADHQQPVEVEAWGRRPRSPCRGEAEAALWLLHYGCCNRVRVIRGATGHLSFAMNPDRTWFAVLCSKTKKSKSPHAGVKI